MKVASLSLAVALALASSASLGQEKKPAATAEDANINLTGDTLRFNSRVHGLLPSDPAAGKTPVTAPKNSCFRISKEMPKDVEDPKDKSKTVPEDYVRGTFRTGWRGLYTCSDEKSLTDAKIDPDQSYEVARRLVLEDHDTTRFGWTYGVLVAPFKYYWSEQSFSTDAMVGPYLGYRLYDRPGSSTVLAGSVGVTNATIKTNNADGTTTNKEANGVTFALAWLFNVKNSFNVGIIGGWDVFSKSDNIENSGKFWLSMSFGRKID